MSNSNKKCRYSFVLPARNGGKYIGDCISSILAQSYPHFELLILENQSEDDTLSIIQSFDDARIKVFFAEKTLTIEENWHRAATVAKNEFMMFTGHDDLFDRDYLQVMNDLVERYPDASLYQSHYRYIDSFGKETGKCSPMDEIQQPVESVGNFVSGRMDVMSTGFLMRSKDFEAAGGMPAYPNLLFADLQLWLELSRKSYLAVDQRELYSYRKHSASTTSGTPDSRLLAAFEQLVHYLSSLRQQQPCLAETIRANGQYLLLQYCLGLTHNILRTPKKGRRTPDVCGVIEQFRQFALELGIPEFDPLSYKKISLGKVIDEHLLLHWLYLCFPKMHFHLPKSVMQHNKSVRYSA